MAEVPSGWAVPTVERHGDECVIRDRLTGYGGDIHRLLAQPNADGEGCATTHGIYRCPLIEGHIGDHWLATPELAEIAAPIRVWAELVA
jgi:hypothetical protein